MTREDKELLLKDLCARLPYGVVIHLDEKTDENDERLYGMRENGGKFLINDAFYIEEVKPYLFPLSSMTEEQKEEYYYIVNYISPDDTENWAEGEFIYVEQVTQLLHFYHINHLDYMGLIPMGLAINATGKNVY